MKFPVHATAALLILGACATGFEAHDNDLPLGEYTVGEVEIRVWPYPQVRDYCRPLLNGTEAMGCATRRPFPGAAATVGGQIVIEAGMRCRITVSPSLRLLEHEMARCDGGSTYVSIPVTKNGEDVP